MWWKALLCAAAALSYAGVGALAPPRAALGRAARPTLRRPAAARAASARMEPAPLAYPASGFTAAESAAPADVASLLVDDAGPKYITVGADEPIGIVANALSQAGRGAAAIVEDDGIVIGIFTERDYLKALNCASDGEGSEEECIVPTDEMLLQTVELIATPVRTYITPVSKLITVDPAYSIVGALRLMGARGIRHLPIIRPGMGEPGRMPVEAVLGVLSVGALADWVQRDSESLQTRYQDRLAEMNPRFMQKATGGEGQVLPLVVIGALFASAVALFTEQTWIAGHWQLVMVGSFVLGCARPGRAGALRCGSGSAVRVCQLQQLRAGVQAARLLLAPCAAGCPSCGYYRRSVLRPTPSGCSPSPLHAQLSPLPRRGV